MAIQKVPVCSLGCNRVAFGPTPGRLTAQLSAFQAELSLRARRRPVLAKSPARHGWKGGLLQPKPQAGVFRIGIIFMH